MATKLATPAIYLVTSDEKPVGTYLIRRETLIGIADAIREVKGIAEEIPVRSFVEALTDGTFTETAETASAEYYQIDIQILIDLADAVRRLTGQTKKIAVSSMAEEIIKIKDVSAVLGDAILGRMILGNDGLPKLNAPIIYLEENNDPKLDTPTIYLEADKLDAPVIYLAIDKLGTPIITIEEV